MEDSQAEADSQSISSDEWQDLSKSEYAKVIFTELCHDSDSGCVRCKFHITDEVQSDLSDTVGLYRVGYEDLDQCIVVRELSQIKSETDSTLYSCIFECDELPELEEGFYQFLYVRAKDEICGASMPFEIKNRKINPYHNNQRCVLEQLSTEDGDFLMVKTQLEKQNETLSAELKALKESLVEEINKKTMLQNQVGQLEKEKLCLRTQYEDQLKKVTEEKQQLHALFDTNIQEIEAKLISVNESGLVELRKRDKFVYEQQGKIQKLNMSERKLQEEVNLLRKKIDEADVIISGYISDDTVKSLSEQLEDHKCMVRALDHSKQMAIKEIATLTASLAHRTDSLNRMKHECASAKENMIKAEEQNEKIQKEKSEIEKNLAEAKELLHKLTLALEISNMNLSALNDKYQNEKKLLEEAIASITKLTKESSEKNELIENLKSNYEEKDACLDKQVHELMGRLEDAAHIYHHQFKEIQQLKKCVKKMQISSRYMPTSIPSSKSGTVSPPHCHISNDSDTGEHNAEIYFTPVTATPLLVAPKTDVISAEASTSETETHPTCWKKKIVKIASVNAQQENENALPPLTSEDKVENQMTDSNAEEPVPVSERQTLSESKGEPIQIVDNVEKQDIPKSNTEEPTECYNTEKPMIQVTSVKNPLYQSLVNVYNEETRTSKLIISCPFCPDAWHVTDSGDAPIQFFDHLDNMHRLRMCPFCGHLFDAMLPDRYLQLHVQHKHAEKKKQQPKK